MRMVGKSIGVTQMIGFNAEDILYETPDLWYPEYRLKVVRTGESTGKLTVTFKGQQIFTQGVPLYYGAHFGVDIMDTETWALTSCRVVNDHLHSRGITAQPPEDQK